MKKVLAGALAVAATALMATPAFGATATANVAVSATVTNNCTITTTPVAFGNYDPLSGSANTNSGTVAITCTKNAVTTLTLGNGTHFSNPNRRMGDGTNFMNYQLYQPPSTVPGAACSYASPTRWGTAGGEIFTPGAAPSKATRTYNVCGEIPAGQDLAAATFSDTVVATVNF